MIKIKSKTRSM